MREGKGRDVIRGMRIDRVLRRPLREVTQSTSLGAASRGRVCLCLCLWSTQRGSFSGPRDRTGPERRQAVWVWVWGPARPRQRCRATLTCPAVKNGWIQRCYSHCAGRESCAPALPSQEDMEMAKRGREYKSLMIEDGCVNTSLYMFRRTRQQL